MTTTIQQLFDAYRHWRRANPTAIAEYQKKKRQAELSDERKQKRAKDLHRWLAFEDVEDWESVKSSTE